ncbi:hypothetical protein QJS66_12010 [Kocuria rhizophila]|nr:hypothetical protein QJS66_12010 [Kocuria rhizophila]
MSETTAVGVDVVTRPSARAGGSRVHGHTAAAACQRRHQPGHAFGRSTQQGGNGLRGRRHRSSWSCAAAPPGAVAPGRPHGGRTAGVSATTSTTGTALWLGTAAAARGIPPGPESLMPSATNALSTCSARRCPSPRTAESRRWRSPRRRWRCRTPARAPGRALRRRTASSGGSSQRIAWLCGVFGAVVPSWRIPWDFTLPTAG